MILGLSDAAFVRTDTLELFPEGPTQADVYGVSTPQGDWYVKIYMFEGDLIIMSCHEPQGTLRRTDGATVGRPRK